MNRIDDSNFSHPFNEFLIKSIIFTNLFCLLVEITLKTLITSCACDMNSSSVALFKYDKNKPQRLTFLETDPTTNKTQEWLIRGDSSFLQVVPKLKMDGISLYEFEPVFHKVL